jgi:hypothetical protein
MAEPITVAENLTASTDNSDVSTTVRIGQSFQAGATAVVTSAVVEVVASFASNGDFFVYIFECDESYLPIGDPIAAAVPRNVDDFDTTPANYTFIFEDSVELVEGGKYAVTMATDAISSVRVGKENTSGYTPGSTVFSVSGGAWQSSPYDQIFGVYGEAGGGGGGGGPLAVDITLFESWGF